MARIVDNGDGTFQYYDDPVQDWRMARDVRAPDPPPFVPNVSPVYQSKNEAARSNFYTPEASADLYNTPTRISYSARSPYADVEGYESVLGTYGGGRITAWDKPQRNSLNDTLNHEYLHKYYAVNNPQDLNDLWQQTHEQFETPGLTEWLNADPTYADRVADPFILGTETYAYTGEHPLNIRQGVREAFYPMFDNAAIAAEIARQEQLKRDMAQMARERETYNPNVRPFTQFQMAYDDAINNDSFRKHMMSKFQQGGPWLTSEAFDY